MNRNVRELRRIIDGLKKEGHDFEHGNTLDLLDAVAKKLEHKRSTPAKALPEKSRKQAKTEKRARYAAETAIIRDAVEYRARGACEMCVYVTGNPEAEEGTEMHHLLGGRGRRREQQAVSNCIMLCPTHHRALHRAPHKWIEELGAWAELHGYSLPSRLAKRTPGSADAGGGR